MIPGPCHLGTAGKGRGGKVSRESSGAAQRSAPDRASPARPRQPVRVVRSTHGVRPWRANRERLRAQFKLRRRLGRTLRAPGSPRSRPLSLSRSSCSGPLWRTRAPSRSVCVCGHSSPGEPPRCRRPPGWGREAQGGITARGWREPGKKGAVVRGPPLGSGAFAQLKVTECLCF